MVLLQTVGLKAALLTGPASVLSEYHDLESLDRAEGANNKPYSPGDQAGSAVDFPTNQCWKGQMTYF